MSWLSSFETIKVVVPEPCVFFLIPVSIAETAAVILNGSKIFFARELQLSLMDQLIYLMMILKILLIDLF